MQVDKKRSIRITPFITTVINAPNRAAPLPSRARLGSIDIRSVMIHPCTKSLTIQSPGFTSNVHYAFWSHVVYKRAESRNPFATTADRLNTMTFEIALVLGILAISLVLFISEVVRMDLVALLVLGALAITGLVDSNEAFAGFSNSAVITVWAMFILSEGLTRTGIADIIGRQVMRLGGKREVPMILVIMITGAVLSAFMNNIGVAALMLPVVVECRATHPYSCIPASHAAGVLDTARRTHDVDRHTAEPADQRIHGAERLCAVRTVRLHADGRRGHGYRRHFRRIGRPIPAADDARERDKHVSQRSLRSRYKLQERTFMLRVPNDSILVGKSLAESRIGASTGLIILSLCETAAVRHCPADKL